MGYFILVPDNLDKAGLKLLQARPDVTVQAAAKMDRNEVKYPAAKVKGSARKYTEY